MVLGRRARIAVRCPVLKGQSERAVRFVAGSEVKSRRVPLR
jgi:hypothetical protein